MFEALGDAANAGEGEDRLVEQQWCARGTGCAGGRRTLSLTTRIIISRIWSFVALLNCLVESLRGRQLAIFDRICIQGNTKELADSMPPVQVILKLGMDENLICAHPDPCRGTTTFVEGQKTLPEQGRCPY